VPDDGGLGGCGAKAPLTTDERLVAAGRSQPWLDVCQAAVGVVRQYDPSGVTTTRRPQFKPPAKDHAMAIWAFLALLMAPFCAVAQPRFDLASTQTRLPKTVLPSHVQLSLDVDPAKDRFTGQMHMQLRAVQQVAHIELHARSLQASSAELRQAGAQPRPMRVVEDPPAQTWRLSPVDGTPIAAGEWSLHIRYQGDVQASGVGLYRVNYKINGEPAQMLATQLQAVDARRLFPSFDEPVFRSVFELDVRAPSGLQVVSNMPLKQALVDGGSTLHRFEATPSMVSYLVALAVGRFDVLEDTVDGIPLRIFTAPGKREQARLAMDVTRQVLPYYTRYFGRPYALPKLDQLAVPSTRDGAMEDWGLISYIEDGLLYDPARSAESTRRGVFSLVAHEIAHQWFGNLVSAASWDEIWLNEAFATWVEEKAKGHFHPEWQTALRNRSRVDRVMARDATSATRAIRAGPVAESSVFSIFDNVTYSKGGAVLSMLEDWLGEAAFQRGLAAYMNERAYRPATAGDLWFHIGAAAGRPRDEVAAVAASWTDQPGLPVISVTQRCEQGQTRVTLRQSRFSVQPEPLPGGPWLVPLRLQRSSQSQTLVFSKPEQTETMSGCEGSLVLLNGSGRGYFHVDYAPAQRALAAQRFTALPPPARIAMVSDSYALASAGRNTIKDHLALLRNLPQVNDNSRAALFSSALTQWRNLDVVLHGTPLQAKLRAKATALFGPELARLSSRVAPNEVAETKILRAELMVALARFGHGPTLSAAHTHFQDALTGGGALPPSMRGAVLAAVGRDASEAEFVTLLAALGKTDSQEERSLLVRALASGTERSRAQRLLTEARSGRLPDDASVQLLNELGREPSLSPTVYAFVLEHWDHFKRVAGEGVFGGHHNLLPDAAAGSSEQAVARALVVDQQRLAGAAGASAAARAVATIENRHRWRERELVAGRW
jgi:aminopeptidase N